MAPNVFGKPITNKTLQALTAYNDKAVITRKDRATVALSRKYVGTDRDDALAYVDDLKSQSGNGVATKCLVYNATGDAVTFVVKHDWFGNIGYSSYPATIENGQWGAFLHVKVAGEATGSTGAVVYRGMNEAGAIYDWMLSWSNPWNRWTWDNTVYTDIDPAGYYTVSDHWGDISKILYHKSKSASNAAYYGCLSKVITSNGTTALFEATLTLQNA